MPGDHSQDTRKTIATQTQSPLPAGQSEVLDYHRPEQSPGWFDRMPSLPRPSWLTAVAFFLTFAAVLWLNADHAAWITRRQFDGFLPDNSPNGVISPDGKQLLAIIAGNRTIRIFDIATGKTVRDLVRTSGDIQTAEFSPDGSRIWSIGNDQTAILWDASTGKSLASAPVWASYMGFINSASLFSPDGRWAVAPGAEFVQVCDGHSGAVVAQLDTKKLWINSEIFSPNSRYLVAAINPLREMRIWDTQTWQPIATFNFTNAKQGINNGDIAISPDSKTLAYVCGLRQVDLWDLPTNKASGVIPIPISGQSEGCNFSPDGRYLLIRENNGPAQLLDMTTQKIVSPSTPRWITVISPDGLCVAGRGRVQSFPSNGTLAEYSMSYSSECVAWFPGSRAFVSCFSRGTYNSSRPIDLIERRRPEAAYGLLWLPQCWVVIVAASLTAWSFGRDIVRWCKGANSPK